jgi:hypothetical protein
LLLARRQRGKAILEVSREAFRGTPAAITANRRVHCVEHVLVAERLRQEVYGTGLHGPNRHGDIAVAGHQDDG